MARDIQLAWQCPHLTVEESVPLGADRRSLEVRQPVMSQGTVRILVNDDTRLEVPQNGLSTAAQLFSAVSGPFDLVENEDTFTVETSAGTYSTSLKIVGNKRRTAAQIIKHFQVESFNIAVVENVNGHLVFTDTAAVGQKSFVRVSGTAAAALGFGQVGKSGRQRSARGKQLFPGWRLHTRPDEITNRFPKFTTSIRGNPLFKVTYSTHVTRCLRCRGSYIENDYRFAFDGHAILVDNEDLLYQAAFKILLTDRGSNPYHTWYGTTIRSRIGSKALAGVAGVLADDVRRALTEFQSLQREQGTYQQVTTRERLYSVLGIQVLPHEQDNTTFLVDVTVQNAAAEPINLSIVFTVPEVVALMGSNGLMLGTEAAGLSAGQASSLFLTAGGS